MRSVILSLALCTLASCTTSSPPHTANHTHPTPATPPAPPPSPHFATQPAKPTLVAPLISATSPATFAGLHQVVTYHPNLYSGAQPEDETSFISLAALGVKTIISVDGATPDVTTAEKHGLQYIHLPIGYNGFDDVRRRELARATKDAHAKGGVYIHCHHGKHRSASAAGTVAVSLGWATTDAMIERMKVSGTAATYTGLWNCTRSADVLTPQQLAAAPATYPSISPPGSFVQNMIELDEKLEHLSLLKTTNWKTAPTHPDLVPAAEAGIAADILRHLSTKASQRKQDEFASLMAASLQAAQTLEDMIVANKPATELNAQLALFATSCKDCHVKYRD